MSYHINCVCRAVSADTAGGAALNAESSDYDAPRTMLELAQPSLVAVPQAFGFFFRFIYARTLLAFLEHGTKPPQRSALLLSLVVYAAGLSQRSPRWR